MFLGAAMANIKFFVQQIHKFNQLQELVFFAGMTIVWCSLTYFTQLHVQTWNISLHDWFFLPKLNQEREKSSGQKVFLHLIDKDSFRGVTKDDYSWFYFGQLLG